MKNCQNIALKTLLISLLLSSCTPNQVTPEESIAQASLTLVANGEDFVRQGFVSKDGWRIDFNNVNVTLGETIAHQTNPPFSAEGEGELQPIKSISIIDKPVTINLAEGDENAPPIKVTEVIAPIGQYNALTWKLVNNNFNSIVLDGTATKDSKTIKFTINIPLELSYVCGEFIGDERKGILEEGKSAELETTFHFDHIFGDKETSADDELNLGALGFQPLSNLATNGVLNTDLSSLKNSLTPEDYGKLVDNFRSLGHVGEGHCRLLQ
ncbi:hypothetical protein [Geminocystis sp. NIES-3709]|uniref:hypothetical protein n=1 Tax=Geminocystis sp. NIES-3709 TaxID=1617448 RepID=UPI0005FCC8CA|nr:hypothetical protein [Geminocystis sp. NIES-3709]BAQ63633.1 hypothetical protein GM3709_398 [Geminocystis sp. NIES-3709]